MKTFRSSFILLFLLLGAGAWWWSEQRAAREGEQENGETVLWRVNAQDVHAFSVSGREELALQRSEKTPDEWLVSREGSAVAPVPADAAVVGEFLQKFSEVRARVVREDAARLSPTQLEEYGLGPGAPRASVRLKGHRLQGGKLAPAGTSMAYARARKLSRSDPQDRIVLVPVSLLAATQKPLQSWRDRRTLPVDAASAKGVSITLPDSRLAFEKAAPSLWRVTSPLRARADASALEGAMATSLSWPARAFWPRRGSAAKSPLARLLVEMESGQKHEIVFQRRGV